MSIVFDAEITMLSTQKRLDDRLNISTRTFEDFDKTLVKVGQLVFFAVNKNVFVNLFATVGQLELNEPVPFE